MTYKDLRQEKYYSNYLASVGWDIDEVDGVYVYSKKVPLAGGVMKVQRPDKIISVNKLLSLAHSRRVKTIFIEAKSDRTHSYYKKNGFDEWGESLLPSKTVRLELVNTKDFILKTMHYKTRYNIKKAIDSRLTIIRSDDIDLFAKFWQKSSLGWGMFLPHQKYIVKLHKAFVDDSKIYLAKCDDQIVAGLQIVSTKRTAYYMYAASTELGKKLFAPTHLAWRAITDAQKAMKSFFDFEGIYDERMPLPAWRGFTKFKLSFGGKVVTYPQPLRKAL